MKPLKKDARDGGAVADRTRKDIEAQTGKAVVSAGNFKQLATSVVRLGICMAGKIRQNSHLDTFPLV